MRHKTIQIVITAIFLLASFGMYNGRCESLSKPESLLSAADKYSASLLRSSAQKKYRHNWLKCIKHYEKIYQKYPESPEAPWAYFHSANLYRYLYRYSNMKNDLDEAIKRYRAIVENYDKHSLADDSQYNIGEIFYKEKKDPSQAYLEFLKIDVKLPGGDMHAKAKKMLDELAVVIAEKDKHADSSPPFSGTDENKGSTPAENVKNELISIDDIRYWSTPNYTRVVIDLKSQVKYTHHLLKADSDLNKPRRLYLDLENTVVKKEFGKELLIKDDLLQRARAGQYTRDTVRVVLDIESIGGYKIFHLFDPFRIVIDVHRNGKKAEETASSNNNKRKARRGIKKADELDSTVSLAKQLGLNVGTIIIDAGHGGKDPGCILSQFAEKDIALNLARILAKKIKESIGCEVVLTRENDNFIPLERRTAIANINRADLFISLHVNAHRNNNIKGIETYFLNMATDERAVMVAARENATSEKNISDLQTILNDLILNTKIHESNQLARNVQLGIIKNLRSKYNYVKDLGVKQAPFYVLIGAGMPAILVEAGFLTNVTERKRLSDNKYQVKIADGICEGIKSYIESIDQLSQGG